MRQAMRRVRQFVRLGNGGTWATAALALAALSAAGCIWLAAGAAAGAAGAVYFQGRLTQTLGKDVAKCDAAAEKALADQKLTVLQNKVDAASAHLEAEYADNQRVWIDMESVGAGATKVTIRVGILGDKEREMALLLGIRRHAGLE